ncbi:MAG: ATP-binding protein [Rhodobacteraceae bacterium]|nr:ATP-binding protein [Paracoccaceae bacterium]
MTNLLSITAQGCGDQWPQIDSQVESFGRANEWPPDLDFTIRLMLEELVLNAVSYGSEDKSVTIHLELKSEADMVRIEMSDDGHAFNPFEDAPSPDLDSGVEQRRVGGLGVHLVKTMADEISYRRLDDMNRIMITKRRDS